MQYGLDNVRPSGEPPVATVRHRADVTLAVAVAAAAFAAGIGIARRDAAFGALWIGAFVVLALGRQVMVLGDDRGRVVRTVHLLVAVFAACVLMSNDAAAHPAAVMMWMLVPVPVAVAFCLGPRAAYGWGVTVAVGAGICAVVGNAPLTETNPVLAVSVFVVTTLLVTTAAAASAAAERRQRRRAARYETEMVTAIGRLEAYRRHAGGVGAGPVRPAGGSVRVLPTRPPGAARSALAEVAATQQEPSAAGIADPASA